MTIRSKFSIQWCVAAICVCITFQSTTQAVIKCPTHFSLSLVSRQRLLQRDHDKLKCVGHLPSFGVFCESRQTRPLFLVAGVGLGQRVEDAATAGDQPTPRTDSNSQIAHAQLLEKASQGGIDIYFEGDSITRRWGTSDDQYKAFLENWRQNFFGWNAANFGWGGDTTQNILWRLKNGELDNVNPKIIVLMTGTNNVGKLSPQSSNDRRIADVTRGIKAILDVCRQKAPRATIVLMGITPRNDNMAVMSIISEINDTIATFADGKKIKYLNINDRLADKDGMLFEGMAKGDGLHLDVKGYQVWADALKPIFTKLLGPPAKEDHAPPPTGDPSNRKTPDNPSQPAIRS